MRNLRKVLALVLAFAMVLSMSSVSFADGHTAAEKVETLGLLKGDGNGVTAEYLAKTPSRLQAAIISLRLQGLEADALAFEGTESFTDAEDILWDGGKAVAAYLKATPEAGWVGYPDGSFMPNEPIGAQAYVKVMLEALGYEQDVDFTWDEVFTFASSMGLTALTAGTTMTNDSLAVGMIDALMAMTKDGEKLIDVLIASGAIDEDDAIAAGLVEVDMDFAVVSVETFGLKAFQVTFASDIDDDEAYEVEVEEGDVDVEEYVVDGKVLTVVLEEVQEQAEELELLISAVGLDAVEVDEEEATVTMVDKMDPVLVSVEVENAKTFVVTFSEPIDEDSYETGTAVFDDVLLDDAKLVGKVEASDDYSELTYTLNKAVAANTYVFTMEDVYDFAGFVAPETEVTVTVVADDAEPQIVEVEVNGTNEIVLIFDENVEDIGDVTVAGNDIDDSDVDIEDEEVTVTLDSPLSASDAFINVKVEWEDVEDVIGNMGDGETTFTAPFDDDAPTVSVEVSSDNELVFIFSEEVEGFEDGSLADIFMIEDDDGDEIAVADFFSGNVMTDETDIEDYEDEDDEDNIYYINLDADYTDVDEMEVTITVDGTDDDSLVTDLSVLANELQEVEFDLTLEDKLAPEVEGDVIVIDGDWSDEDDETLRMAFNEEMDADTLSDVGNYILDNEPLKNYDYEIDVADDNMSVDILVEETTLAALVLEVYGLEDAAGNGLTVSKTIGDMVASFDGVTFTLTELDTIEVEYASGTFLVADPDEFILVYSDDDDTVDLGVYVTNAVVDEDDDNIIILSLSDDLTAYGEYDEITDDGSLKVYVRVEGDDTVNAFDTPLVQAMTMVSDDVSATAEIDMDDDDDNLVVVSFDEVVSVDATDLANSILIYNEDEEEYESPAFMYYYADDSAASAAGFTYFTFELIADDEYTIELISRYVEDMAGNVAGGVDEDTYNPE